MKNVVMQKVFWQDPYQSVLDTKVAAVCGNDVLFEKTIAYSFCGGQESDKATVNDLEVVGSRMEGSLIWYTFAENHGFREGMDVVMKIDWSRRYKLMRLHFAAELILELVTQKLNLEKVGAHIAESKARIDFKSSDVNISSIFESLLQDYNAIIKSDKPIITDFSDRENQRRFWKIDGFAQVPCGGTHVKSTVEVGFVTLKREKPGKSIERIEIRLIN